MFQHGINGMGIVQAELIIVKPNDAAQAAKDFSR